ncbi:VWA domain-containing protein [Pelagibius sp. CAU 1746]|uniref:VWA domain-containing protein n=1 Tax=Pelagibius sp. CAU 1746 TaxID=3140370 RepID=UPI00325A575B
MAKDPKLPQSASASEVEAFLRKVSAAPARGAAGGARGRLIFAMDATASREPTWDRASHLQAEMFKETEALGGLEVQLMYYRGFGECRASRWVANSGELLRFMTGVFCLAGRTQIGKVLKRAIKETREKKVSALVFVGDAMEEDIDHLGHLAGELGLLGVPCFMFHEGDDPVSRNAFQQVARLSGGAFCNFDSASARQLRDLLSAVAVFAAGGRPALADYGKRTGGLVPQITHQLK